MTIKEKRIKTTDDWFPCFPGKMVEVSLLQDGPGRVRIAIWGEDDFGMEKSFKSLMLAKEEYKSIPEPITIEWLKKNDFEQA